MIGDAFQRFGHAAQAHCELHGNLAVRHPVLSPLPDLSREAFDRILKIQHALRTIEIKTRITRSVSCTIPITLLAITRNVAGGVSFIGT